MKTKDINKMTREELIEYIHLERQIKKEAIEYINKHWGSWCSNHYRNATNVVNILKGSDKE